MEKFLVAVVLSTLFVGSFARSVPIASDNLENDVQLLREKRQFGGFGPQNYGQSSALANANSYGQYQGPGGFGASSGMGQAQAFNSQGPLGGFGASAANTGTQSFHAGPGGIQGSAGMSGSQTYDLPGGKHINLAYGQTYGANNGQMTGGGSNSLTYTK